MTQTKSTKAHNPDCNSIRFNKNHLCSCEALSAPTQKSEKGQKESTPRPWRLGFGADDDSAHYIVSVATERIVAELDTDSSIADAINAELIVRAVNSHEGLLEACKAADRLLVTQMYPQTNHARKQLRDAVLKAEGRQ